MSNERETLEETRLEMVRQLIAEGKLDAARSLLETMPDNPQAQNWLDTISQLDPPGESDGSTQDPYGQDEFPYDEGQPRPFAFTPKSKIYEDFPVEDFRRRALWTLIGYTIWVVGFMMNLAYLNEARNLEQQGVFIKGKDYLWALLVLGLVAPCVIVAVFVYVTTSDAVGNVFQVIVDTLEAPAP